MTFTEHPMTQWSKYKSDMKEKEKMKKSEKELMEKGLGFLRENCYLKVPKQIMKVPINPLCQS